MPQNRLGVFEFVRLVLGCPPLLGDDGATELNGGGAQKTEKDVRFALLVSGRAGGACGRPRVGVMQESRGCPFGRLELLCARAAVEEARPCTCRDDAVERTGGLGGL